MVEPADSSQPYVFLSYSSPDRTRVLALAGRLEEAGIRVWVDRRDLVGGSSWDTSIVRAIAHCTVFALTCTAASLVSPNVQQEVRLAWEEQRPILPLLLASVTIPADLRYPLAGRQWVELLDRPEQAWLPDVLRALEGLGIMPTLAHAAVTASPAVSTHVHLPTPLTSFIGREQELAELSELLRRIRLLTLTGTGGTGKTRLALAAAVRVADTYADGAWFVDLSDVRQPTDVIPAIAQVLAVAESDGRSLAVSLAAYLRYKRLLLVLDNFEHVLAAAVAVSDLLSEAPALSILVTSRELLRVGGERPYTVPPLPLPDPQQAGALEAVAGNAAVQLFVNRARDLRPDFALTPETAPLVAAICARLDGLPLAIELAAARVRLLPPAALLARLEQRSILLVGRERSRPERQQTLRATIAWSWALLSEEEQRSFRRLAVFAGGWTLAAAEAVCDHGDADVLGGLESLIDKSLVRQADVNGELRLSMLPTLREFALEQLGASGEAAALQQRHVEYYAAFLEQVDARYWQTGQFQRDVLTVVDPERDNVAAAFAWARDAGDAAIGLRLAAGSFTWYYAHSVVEGRRWAEVFLALPAAMPADRTRGRALWAASAFCFQLGDGPAAVAYVNEAIAIQRALRDMAGLSRSLLTLSMYLPPDATADAVVAEAIATSRASGEQPTQAFAEWAAGLNQLGPGGDLDAARAHLTESLRLARAIGADYFTLVPSKTLARVAQLQGQREEARDLLAAALPMAEAMSRPDSYEVYASLGLLTDDLAAAADAWRNALSLAQELGNAAYVATCLYGAARVLASRGDAERAAQLTGAADKQQLGDNPAVLTSDMYYAAHDAALAATRAALSEEAYAQAWAEGQAMTLEQAETVAGNALAAM